VDGTEIQDSVIETKNKNSVIETESEDLLAQIENLEGVTKIKNLESVMGIKNFEGVIGIENYTTGFRFEYLLSTIIQDSKQTRSKVISSLLFGTREELQPKPSKVYKGPPLYLFIRIFLYKRNS
jgi:hypothetical protein